MLISPLSLTDIADLLIRCFLKILMEILFFFWQPLMSLCEEAQGVDDGQGSLACCCSPRGCKESDTTERLK